MGLGLMYRAQTRQGAHPSAPVSLVSWAARGSLELLHERIFKKEIEEKSTCFIPPSATQTAAF